MGKSTLATNFQDDELDSSMGGLRRYKEIQNSDGTVSFEDVTDYTQIGSTFGASQINAINKAVNASFDASKVIDDYDTLMATTESGYAAGALAVKDLNDNLINYTLLTNITPSWVNGSSNPSVYGGCRIDISALYDNYKNITMDSIFVITKGISTGSNLISTWTYTYDSNTGIISLNTTDTSHFNRITSCDILILKL